LPGQKEFYVLGVKLRAGLLGLVAMLVLGALSAAPAFAVGGPFCHHRAVGAEGEGTKITEAAPEGLEGKGGEQKLVGKILGIETEITSKGVEVKGIVYNNALQCQLKLELKYIEPKLEKIKGCEVKVGINNTVKLFGHQDWKWNGTKEQLEEKPQAKQFREWLFIPVELKEGFTEIPKGPYVNIIISKLGGAACSLAEKEPTQFPVTESAGGESIENTGLNKWGTKETISIKKGEIQQHDWNGKEFVGFTSGLFFAGNKASYTGETTTKTVGFQGGAAQEVGYFES
jgi:hypothetical protein